MGWTVAVGMITSLPFLIFSGPITDLVGHINVIIIGMVAYFVRMIGYSFLQVCREWTRRDLDSKHDLVHKFSLGSPFDAQLDSI